MKGLHWMAKLNPVDALAKRAGRKAVEGARDAITYKETPVEPDTTEPVESTSLFKSRSFWFNALTIAAELSGALTGVVPPGALTVAVSAINIGLRLLSKTPVHVITPKPAE